MKVSNGLASLPWPLLRCWDQSPRLMKSKLKTEKGKAVALGNFLNTPGGCSSNPGPNPLPRLGRSRLMAMSSCRS